MIIRLFQPLIALILFSGCTKEFLEKKPNDNIVIPKTLKEIQGLLDNETAMNNAISLGELSSDQYFVTDNVYSALMTDLERNFYVWAKEIYMGKPNLADWNIPYQQILYANVALEALEKYNGQSSNEVQFRDLKGAALFFRAWAHYNLSQVFAPPYDEVTANSKRGVPLKLKADINEQVTRPTLKENYERIIEDLTQAEQLLSTTFEISNRNRPSKVAVYALLSRVYLSMRSYELALKYCELALKDYSKLIDYNTVPNTQVPFVRLNDEAIIQSQLSGTSFITLVLTYSGIGIDTALYKLYEPNDLRKTIFFTITNNFVKPKIGYTGFSGFFGGLATDELYLIKAECLARGGSIDESMGVLNQLLINRFKTGTFIPKTASSPEDALDQVLVDRRKELVFRGVRWTDLRRLNLEGRNITLHRQVAGKTYELPANSPLYVLPIPDDVIGFSGIQQNQR